MEITHRTSPLLLLTMQHRSKVKNIKAYFETWVFFYEYLSACYKRFTIKFQNYCVIKLQVDVTMRFQKSMLEDFSGVLVVDSNSNSNLNLTLFNVKGSIHGIVNGYNSSQAIHISIGSTKVHKKVHKLIRLTGMVSCVPPR